MFQQLIESNVVRRPRVGSSSLSMAGHAALIAAAIAATATTRARVEEVVEPRVAYVSVPKPPETLMSSRSDTPSASATAAATQSTTPALHLDAEIVVGIPPIDLTRPFSSADDWTQRGSSAHRSGTSTGLDSPDEAVAIHSAEQVDKAAMMAPGAPTPAFPEVLRAAGLSGSVMMEFVVDTTGRVEPGSLRLVQADHELFALAVQAVIPRLRFLAAEVRGRKVRQLVRLPVRFDVRS
jgi:protein TonB